MGFPFRDLRDWIAELAGRGELVVNRTEVDIRGEIAAISRKLALTEGPAVLHENVRGYPGWRVFSDGLTTRDRQLLALNLPSQETLRIGAERLAKHQPVEPRVVEHPPCKEVKLLGDDIDLVRIPMAFSGEREGVPYITAGISFVKDPETGWTNAGIRRFQCIGRDELCDLVLPYQHEGVIFFKYLLQNRPMPIAIVVGTDPVACLCQLFTAPEQVDEMSYWSAFTGEPMEMVKCETNDILVPARAEIVIEGQVDPQERVLEGPFAEFPGYYSGYRMCPVVKVTAVTMRRDPIYRFMYMALPPSEGHSATALGLEIELYRQLKALIPEVHDVGVLSTMSLTTAVSVSKKARLRSPGLEKKVGLAIKSVKAGGFLKNVFIVDDDVDVHNLHAVLWSFSVKFQPAKDITVISDLPGMFLDPSEMWVGRGGKYSGHSSYAFYDCTEKQAPYDEGYRRGLALPPKESMETVEARWSQYGFR